MKTDIGDGVQRSGRNIDLDGQIGDLEGAVFRYLEETGGPLRMQD